MKISNTFNYNKIQFDQENEVILMTSLKAPEVKSESKRAPLNLSLVLDASSSMCGDKIDKLRKSVCKLIEQLSDKDMVTITLYESNVEEILAPTLMTASNKAKAIAQVKGIHTSGCTNMSGGMLKGFEQLKKCELKKGSVYRMLLFTDGQANLGLTQKNQFFDLVKNQINDSPLTVSCFGYGQHHSEDILNHIVEAGKGNFYYIDKVDDIGKSFARELGGLLTCFAQNISISLSMKEKRGEFIEVLNDLEVKAEDNGRDMTVSLDDMYSEEEQYILIKTKLNKTTKAVTQRANTVVDVLITYNDLTDKGKTKEVRSKAKIHFVKKEDVQKDPTVEVQEQLAIIELAKAHEVARGFADVGNWSAAQNAYEGVQGICGSTGLAGSTIGAAIAADASLHSHNMDSVTYTAAMGMEMSNSSRGLKKRKSMGGMSATMFSNKTQLRLEDEFSDDSESDDSNTLVVDGTAGSANLDIQTGSPLNTTTITITSPDVSKTKTVTKKSLSKKRSRS